MTPTLFDPTWPNTLTDLVAPQLDITTTPLYKDLFEIVPDHEKVRSLYRLVESERTMAATYGLGAGYLALRGDYED